MIIGHFLPLDRILNQSTTDIISDQSQDTNALEKRPQREHKTPCTYIYTTIVNTARKSHLQSKDIQIPISIAIKTILEERDFTVQFD